MSYAQAAGNGNRQENQKKYFNAKMLTCWSKEVALEDLVEAIKQKNSREADYITESQIQKNVCFGI